MKKLYSEITKDGRALRLVSPLYAGKSSILTAALQYVYQAVKLGASGQVEEGRRIELLGGDALRDLEICGTLIARLGANPIFAACPPYPVSYHTSASVDYAKTLPAMLVADIRLEKSLLEQLSVIAEQLGRSAVGEIVAELAKSARGRLSQLETMHAKA